jgi:hypothetical protein
MSHPEYANWVPLPAPITSGSGVQSFTDPIGDVWVAANGVNGGAWKRARDVLTASIYRSGAAYSAGSGGYQTVLYDTVAARPTGTGDAYGMFTGAGVFTVPISGLYQCNFVAQLQAITAACVLSLRIMNGGQIINAGAFACSIAGQYPSASLSGVTYVNAGSTILAQSACGLASQSMNTGPSAGVGTIAYLGTG